MDVFIDEEALLANHFEQRWSQSHGLSIHEKMGSGHHGLSISKPDNGTHLCFWLMFILYLQETNCLDQCLYFSSGDMWAHTTTFQSIQCQMPNPMFQLKGGATQTKLSQTHPRSHGKKTVVPRTIGWPDAFPPVFITPRISLFCRFSAGWPGLQACTKRIKLSSNLKDKQPTQKSNGQFLYQCLRFFGGESFRDLVTPDFFEKILRSMIFLFNSLKKIPKRKCPWEKTN